MTTVQTRVAPRRFRIAPIDRPWAGAGAVACLFGPLRPGSPEAVLDAARRLAAAGPQTRVGLTHDGRSWTWDPDAVDERWLTVLPGADEDEFRAAVAREYAAPVPTGAAGRPLRFLVSERYFAMFDQHLLADGFHIMRIAAAIMSMSRGADLPAWTAEAPTPRPLSSALWRTFGQHPGAVRTMLADRPQLPAPAGGTPEDWTPQPRLAFARTTTAGRKALVAWGATHAPGATLGALTLALLRVGLAAEGIALDGSSSVAINARRYLPRGAVVDGNFAARVDIAPAEPDSPAALHDALERTGASGRPLAALAASALAARRGRVENHQVPQAVSGAPGHIGFSYFGRPMDVERLPWDAPVEQRHILGGVDPGGPEQIGTLAFLVGGGLQLSVNFHASRFPAARVEAALGRIAADPVAVLAERARG